MSETLNLGKGYYTMTGKKEKIGAMLTPEGASGVSWLQILNEK